MTKQTRTAPGPILEVTPWFPRSVEPVRKGWYECAAQISRSVPNMLIRLEWDGRGFLTEIPLIVNMWRGLTKASYNAKVKTLKTLKKASRA